MALAPKRWKSLCGSHSDLRLSRTGGCKGLSVLKLRVEEEEKLLQNLRVDRREGISMIRKRVREDHAQCRRRLRWRWWWLKWGLG